MTIRKISKKDFDEWVSLGVALWPKHTKREIEKEFRGLRSSRRYKTFLAVTDRERPVAFINLSLRRDYVEGSTSSPVGYIEGIYVKPAYRKHGGARELIRAAEGWAKKRGAKELASDTELQNTASQKFHKRVGFTKVDVIVHVIKKI